jgi:hypothetical protein
MLQGGVSVSLAEYSAVKGIRKGRRLASALEPQAKNGAIELKQQRLDPVSIKPVSHLVHLDGDAVAVTVNFNNVHGGTPLESGGLGVPDHYNYVTVLGPDRCQPPMGCGGNEKSGPSRPFRSWAHVRVMLSRAPLPVLGRCFADQT